MTTLQVRVTLSHAQASELHRAAQDIDVTPDQLIESLTKTYLDEREIQAKMLSAEEIRAITARSPLAAFLQPDQPPKFHNGPHESAEVSYAVNPHRLPDWRVLSITQDIGLPMHWNAKLLNIDDDRAISSAGEREEEFAHPQLAQALQALYEALQAAQPNTATLTRGNQ